ncbi:MAG: TonB-dependent receptor [Planctomycetes bacterium]|nr:TonB-dependent receptor [Planctomycetota bacterium]
MPPAPLASPLPWQASAAQDVAADGAMADDPLDDADDILSLADEPLEILARENVVIPTDPVVTAVSKKAEKASESPGIVDVITAEDIRQFGAKNLYEVLQWATSVYMTGSFFNPRNVASMRGDLFTHNDNHILVLINGRPFRDTTQGGINIPIYTAFPIHMIDRVEVLRGPGSVLYGTNGVAGVINVVTTTPEEQTFHVSVLGGSHGLEQYSVAQGAGTETRGICAGATYTRQEGWPFSATSEDPPGPRTPEFDSTLYGEDNIGIFTMYRNGGFTANAFVADTSSEHLGAIPVWPSGELDTTRVFLDLGYLHEIDCQQSADFHFTYNFAQGVFPKDPLPLGYSPPLYTIPTGHSFLVEGTYRAKLTPNIDLLAGGLMDIHIGDSTTGNTTLSIIPAFEEIWYGVYLQLDYRVCDWLKLVGGVQGNLPGEIPGGAVPRAAVIVSPTENWTGKILYGQAFRSPFQIERSILAAPIVMGNPDLTPETVQTFDVQLAYHTDRFRLAATYFHSDYFDLITRVGAVPATYENAGTMKFDGVELENEWRISEQLRWLGSVTYQDNVRDGVHDTTHVPNWMAKMGLAYHTCNGWMVGVFDTYYGTPSPVTVVNPAALIVNPVPSAYHLLSLNATLDLNRFFHWHTGRSMKLQFLVQNLLDERIDHPEFARRTINSLPAGPGRTVYGGFTMDY